MRKTSSYQTVSAEASFLWRFYPTNRMQRILEEFTSNPVEFICKEIGPVESCHSLMAMTLLQKHLGTLVFYLRQHQMQYGVHRDTCSPYHSFQAIITVLCFAQSNSLRSSAKSTSDLPSSSSTYTCFLSDLIPFKSASLHV
jgi:hypothetical protein